MLADIAQAVIGTLVEPVEAELAETHGRIARGRSPWSLSASSAGAR